MNIKKCIIKFILSIILLIIVFSFSKIDLGLGTRQGNFFFLNRDENGVQFMFIPDTEND